MLLLMILILVLVFGCLDPRKWPVIIINKVVLPTHDIIIKIYLSEISFYSTNNSLCCRKRIKQSKISMTNLLIFSGSYWMRC